MKTINSGKNVIELYDSIDELPIENFNLYNKYLLIDSGIGSDLEDFDIHIERILAFMNNDKESAVKELLNMRQLFYFINQGINNKHLAFCALIKSVNSVNIESMNDSTVKKMLSSITDLTVEQLNVVFDDIKKKLEFEIATYFPGSESLNRKQAWVNIKKKTSLMLDAIINEKNYDNEISIIDGELLNMLKPQKYDGANGVEVQYMLDYEKTCHVITKEVGLNAKTMTTLQFMVTREELKKQNSKAHKTNKKHGRPAN